MCKSDQSVVRVHRYPSRDHPADLSNKCRAQLNVEDAMSTIGGVQYVAVAGGMKNTVTQQTEGGPAWVAILAVAKR
jgi:hypothetical protein